MFLPALVLSTVAMAAGLAAPLSIELTVQAGIANQDGTVVVRGTVQCSTDTIVSIEGDVVESLNRSEVASGWFSTDVTCDTTPTPWTVIVVPYTAESFRPGFATVGVRAVGFDSETGTYAGVESLDSLRLTRSHR